MPSQSSVAAGGIYTRIGCDVSSLRCCLARSSRLILGLPAIPSAPFRGWRTVLCRLTSRRSLTKLTSLLRRRVLIGDSIERFSVDYFCSMMDGDLSLIDLNHPYSPAPFKNGRDELYEDAETISTWVADGRPHWCRISQGGLELNLISFFMCTSAHNSGPFAHFR